MERAGSLGSLGSLQTPEQLRELADARLPRELLPLLRAEVAVPQLTGLPARMEAEERLANALLVLRGDDDPGACLPNEPCRGAVGRDGGEDRPLGGEVLEDLPGGHDAAAACRLRQQEQV